MSELKNAADKLLTEFTEFKAQNDRRLAEIEKKNTARAEQDQVVDRVNAAVGDLQKQLDEIQKRAARVPVGGGEDPEKKAKYRKSFRNFVRTGKPDELLMSNQVEVADDTKGGYLVPSEVDSEIEKYERDANPMRQACRVVSASSEDYTKLVKQGQAASGWQDAEDAARAGDDTTATWKALTPFFGAVFSEPYVTQKMLDDAGRDIVGELSEDVGVEFAEQENAAFTNGTGLKKPKGLLAYTASTSEDGTRAFDQLGIKNSGTNGAFDGDDLIDLMHAVHAGYRGNGRWMLSNLTLAYARKLKDSNGVYLWQPGLTLDHPQSLLGRPITENEEVADVATDALAVLFGDFRRAYTIVDIRGTRLIRDDITTKGKIKLYHWKRVGGFMVNNRAVKALKLSA